ncbi:MAG: c-type cytochrome [Novosphingobium sp.]|nr:c-type cytochrome [Novosphingobium sp.]
MVLFAAVLAMSGCSREKRVIDADQPVTERIGAQDPRAHQFGDNLFQVSQGGRYFAWYGCNGCHGENARGRADLADGHWRHGATVDRVFASITGHGPTGLRIPVEQRWQLAAYVQQLPRLDPAYRRRQDIDQVGEAQADQWQGPVR